MMRSLDRDRRLLIPYWLRAVRVGVTVTALTVAVLAIAPFIPGHDEVDAVPYAILLAAAALGAVGVALLPWPRLFEGPRGLRTLFIWSASDILLVTMAVELTGGASSDVFLIYALTTVFFAAAYPPRAQAALLALTEAAYVAGLWVGGWGIGAGVLFLRLSVLALVAVLANFLAGELLRQIGEVGEARERSERWASMLSIVAEASRQMSLDPEAVVDAACDGLLGLGFEAVSLSALDEEGLTYRVSRARGLPEEYTREVHQATEGMTGMVLEAGRSVVVEDYPSLDRSIPSLRTAGFRTVVASPVWVGGWLGAVLIAGTRREGALAPQEVEAVEMLAGQLGMALENVQRFEEERRTVERLAELDRLKGDFLTTVSHELRTPVTVIKGVGITLERTWDEMGADVRREMITGLNSNAALLEGLIANLLDLSRVAGSRTEVAFESFSLSEQLSGRPTASGGSRLQGSCTRRSRGV